MGRGLPFYGRIGSQDYFAHPIGVEQGFKFACAELLGPDAVERREVSHEHEVMAAIASGLLDRHDVSRGLDHADQRGA